jgi:hypothetical protein
MKKNSKNLYSNNIKMLLIALICSVTISGCSKHKKYVPVPAPKTDTILGSNFNSGGSGGIILYWVSTSDNAELTTGKIELAPGKAAPDSAFHLAGTDTDADWWMGTALGNSNNAFGLPADISNIKIKFDIYVTGTTSNAEIQLQEADGDAFSYNLGGSGIVLVQNTWQSLVVPLESFTLTTWAHAGDNILNSASLKNISFALISGVSTGNSANVYIDNVKFLVTE